MIKKTFGWTFIILAAVGLWVGIAVLFQMAGLSLDDLPALVRTPLSR